ncbi:MAG: hypothetical protein V1727_03835 [Candidatus Omnitrophota bacterium]
MEVKSTVFSLFHFIKDHGIVPFPTRNLLFYCVLSLTVKAVF